MLLSSLYITLRYEINLANPVLFDNLRLDGMEELLPGRLFTTRMPRNIKTDPDSAKRFVSKCKDFHLHTVLILTEKEEYEKYAGADLEEFYKSLGLEVIHRPIADFTIPNQPDMIQNIKVCLLRKCILQHTMFLFASFPSTI